MFRSIVTDLSDQLPHPASLHRYKCLATFRPSYYIILNGELPSSIHPSVLYNSLHV
jgi:hypothetical protein